MARRAGQRKARGDALGVPASPLAPVRNRAIHALSIPKSIAVPDSRAKCRIRVIRTMEDVSAPVHRRVSHVPIRTNAAQSSCAGMMNMVFLAVSLRDRSAAMVSVSRVKLLQAARQIAMVDPAATACRKGLRSAMIGTQQTVTVVHRRANLNLLPPSAAWQLASAMLRRSAPAFLQRAPRMRSSPMALPALPLLAGPAATVNARVGVAAMASATPERMSPPVRTIAAASPSAAMAAATGARMASRARRTVPLLPVAGEAAAPEEAVEVVKTQTRSACSPASAAPASTAHGISGVGRRGARQELVRAEMPENRAPPATTAAMATSALRKPIRASRNPRRRAIAVMGRTMTGMGKLIARTSDATNRVGTTSVSHVRKANLPPNWRAPRSSSRLRIQILSVAHPRR